MIRLILTVVVLLEFVVGCVAAIGAHTEMRTLIAVAAFGFAFLHLGLIGVIGIVGKLAKDLNGNA